MNTRIETPSRVPTLALDVAEACQALGVSWKTWQEHIAADVRIVRVGRRKLVSVRELERWLDDHGQRVPQANRNGGAS